MRRSKAATNTPDLWQHQLPRRDHRSNKYTHGHALIMGGPVHSTGAARLAALSALRSGAGLVSIGCDALSLPVYASSLMSVMTKLVQSPAELEQLLADNRIRALLAGPGAGTGEHTRQTVLQLLKSRKPCVLDADALTSFSDSLSVLIDAVHESTILTPHEGEFTRLFGDIQERELAALDAAQQSKAVVILKGHETVIAAADGRIVVNRCATPNLATAGSGDVLAGIVTGMLCQGMPAFEAACAGVWLHSQSAHGYGPGLIADDLPGLIPKALASLEVAG